MTANGERERLLMERAARRVREIMAGAEPMSDELKDKIRDVFRPVLGRSGKPDDTKAGGTR